jgi:hypothetical protein
MKLLQKIKLKRQKNKIMKELFVKIIGHELSTRLGAETPTFFKKVRLIGVVLTAVGASIATATIALPAIVITAGGYLAFVGGTMVFVAQTAVTDASVLDKKD